MKLFDKIKKLVFSNNPNDRYAPSKTMMRLQKHSTLVFITTVFYLGGFIYFAYKNQHQTSLIISKTTERISEMQIPKFMRKFLYGLYCRFYNVNTSQILDPLDSFNTFSQFFIRKIIPRAIDTDLLGITAPADSKILKIEQITSDNCSIIKGRSYSLGELLTGSNVKLSKQQIDNLKINRQNKLYQAIFYLAPGDYHRFHSPANYTIKLKHLIQGSYFSVNEKNLLKKDKIYEKNTRLCVHGKWTGGYLGMIMIGALNVGRIVFNDDNYFQKGKELGYFNLGSTIVLIFEAKGITQWTKTENSKVKYGEKICTVIV